MYIAMAPLSVHFGILSAVFILFLLTVRLLASLPSMVSNGAATNGALPKTICISRIWAHDAFEVNIVDKFFSQLFI